MDCTLICLLILILFMIYYHKSQSQCGDWREHMTSYPDCDPNLGHNLANRTYKFYPKMDPKCGYNGLGGYAGDLSTLKFSIEDAKNWCTKDYNYYGENDGCIGFNTNQIFSTNVPPLSQWQQRSDWNSNQGFYLATPP